MYAFDIFKKLLYKIAWIDIISTETEHLYVSCVIYIFSLCPFKVIISIQKLSFPCRCLWYAVSLIALISINKSATLKICTQFTLLITAWTHTWRAFINEKLVINQAISKHFSLMPNLGGKKKQCNQFLEAISEIYKKNHYIAYWV